MTKQKMERKTVQEIIAEQELIVKQGAQQIRSEAMQKHMENLGFFAQKRIAPYTQTFEVLDSPYDIRFRVEICPDLTIHVINILGSTYTPWVRLADTSSENLVKLEQFFEETICSIVRLESIVQKPKEQDK